MNFSDQPTLTVWQVVGCAVYFVVMAIICFMALVTVIFDGWDEPPMPSWLSFFLFPGLPILAVIGAVPILRFFMRDKN